LFFVAEAFMRRSGLVLSGIFLALVAFGCTSDKSDNSNSQISESDIPTAVQAAFFSQHPYAKIDKPLKQSDDKYGEIFVIPYTLAGGATGSATYNATGALVGGQ
jgi:hypothetical protein